MNLGLHDTEWGEWFYAAEWINSSIPNVAVPGNHEYSRNRNGIRTLSPHWKMSFNFPMNGPAGLEETVYHFDYGDAKFYRAK